MIESSRTDQTQIFVAGLPAVPAWIAGQTDGLLPAGGLIALTVSGLASIQQTFGATAGMQLWDAIITRLRQVLPPEAPLLQDNGNILFVWLPGMTDFMLQAFVSHLRQAVCTTPIALPEGEQITPKLIFATHAVAGGTPATTAVQAVQNALTQQPDFLAAPSRVAHVISATEELARRLGAVRLYGMDGMVERILAHLSLPALTAKTAVILGPARAGKSRLLTSLGRLLAGQRLPLAEIICVPEGQSTAYGTLHTLIYHLLSAYPPEALQMRLQPALLRYPWLPAPFPCLRLADSAIPAPPAEASLLAEGYQAVLHEILRVLPHVTLVHHLQWADIPSLAVLATLQQTPGLGLRLVATVDDAGEAEHPATLAMFAGAQPLVLPTPALRQDQVLALLSEVVPDIAQPAIAAALLEASNGLPLAVEETLQAWAEHGMLTFTDYRWHFYPERAIEPAAAPPPLAPENDLFALAALACPASLSFLSLLWEKSAEDTRVQVERGRAQGLFAPPDAADADLVQVTSAETVVSLTRHLAASTKRRLHAQIAAALEAQGATEGDEYLTSLVYHYTEAGDEERARQFAELLQLRTAHPADPPPTPIGGIEDWDIPPAEPIGANQLDLVIDTAIMLRLAGVQFRLYPATSQIVRTNVHAAFKALERLLAVRNSLIFTFDGRTVGIDGQVLARRDLLTALKDFHAWMLEGHLRAIGFTRGLREADLGRFLEVLVTFADTREEGSSLLRCVQELNLGRIRVLESSFQTDLPYLTPPSNTQPSLPGMTGLDGQGDGNGMTADIMSKNYVPDALSMEHLPDAMPTLANPLALEPLLWERVPAMLDEATHHARRVMMGNLARWLIENRTNMEVEIPDGVDVVLRHQLAREVDTRAFFDVTVAVEQRLENLMRRRNWPEIIAFLEAIQQRKRTAQDAEICRVLETLVTHIGDSLTLRDLIDTAAQSQETIGEARKIIKLLGEHALVPLINALKNTVSMQERLRLMNLLREFGDTQQKLLLQELRRQNPWYVYRNILQVIAEVGTEEALGAVSEKLRYDDPRVRAEAVTAAARIAKAKATPYLSIGLDDDNAEVRARAVASSNLCMNPRLQSLLIQHLQDTNEVESVQINACLALGAYQENAARELLLKIINPGIFSPFRRKSDELRAAALCGLEHHLDHPDAMAAIQAAMKSNNQLLRSTAQRVWQHHANRPDSPPTA